MTCIVGFVKNGKVYMGADSAGISKIDLTVRKDPKVFINGSMIFGFTSSFRMGQLLQHSLKIPRHPKGMDSHKFMVTLFVDAVRKCLKTGGCAKSINDEEEAGTFLVGYKGQLYQIDSDYQVGMQAAPFMSVGCGESYALGALYALTGQKLRLEPNEMVEIALRAAEQYSGGVRGPFLIKEL
jgi:ATP-dependent protease HslVU (ClpYQ) peptidase subunit